MPDPTTDPNERYHCCATCVHFRISRIATRHIRMYCSRLQYETKTHYKFDCWQPRLDIAEKLKSK